MTDLNKIRNAFSGMILKTALSPAEVRQSVRDARSPAYWRKLNPQLSVSDRLDLGKVKARPVSAAAKRAALRKLDSDGYFRLDSVYPKSLLQRLRQGIENLNNANWPPIFAYVYDEFWIMKRIPSLVGLLDEVLGPDHQELRNDWAHYIRPTPGAHGWAPHLDGPFLSGRLSVWFPITDSTLDNGCIYIVPEGRLPQNLVDSFSAKRRFTVSEMRLLLQSARALPVPAGSVLGWKFRVLHWGSIAGTTAEPRISVATEFVSQTALGREMDDDPIDSHSSIPGFDVRLEIIGRALQCFHPFEPRMLRYQEVARHLWEG